MIIIVVMAGGGWHDGAQLQQAENVGNPQTKNPDFGGFDSGGLCIWRGEIPAHGKFPRNLESTIPRLGILSLRISRTRILGLDTVGGIYSTWILGGTTCLTLLV